MGPPFVGAPLGNRLIHTPSISFRFASAPHPRAWPRWRLAAWMTSALLAVALLLSAGVRPEAGAAGPTAAGSVLVAHDLHDGDPPLDGQHRELPAKKRRLDNLLVPTSHASAVTGPQGFHLHAVASNPDICRPTPGIAFDLSIPAHRADPALRLHPGQAPPHAA